MLQYTGLFVYEVKVNSITDGCSANICVGPISLTLILRSNTRAFTHVLDAISLPLLLLLMISPYFPSMIAELGTSQEISTSDAYFDTMYPLVLLSKPKLHSNFSIINAKHSGTTLAVTMSFYIADFSALIVFVSTVRISMVRASFSNFNSMLLLSMKLSIRRKTDAFSTQFRSISWGH